MKIRCVGWYDHHNTGDEAYKLAFPKLFPDGEISFAENAEGADDVDLIILGGGDVVSSSFTNRLEKLPHKKR